MTVHARATQQPDRARDHERAPDHDRSHAQGESANAAWLRLQRAAGNQAVGWALARLAAGAGAAADGAGPGIPPVVQRVLSEESGRPLDPALRRRMAARLGHDFRGVRIHTGEQAAASALALGARAYTHGQHVVFGAGRYVPESRDGQRLLAHELAHVVQQGRGGLRPALDPHGPLETSAERAADGVTGPGCGPVAVAGASAPGLARAPATVGELERDVWARVPDSWKPALRPVAERARDAAHTVVDPATPLPQQVKPVVDQALRTEEAVFGPPAAPAAAAAPAQGPAPGQAAKPKPKPKPKAPLIPNFAGKEILRDKSMAIAGTVKGVALEAGNIVDTVIWAGTVGVRSTLDDAAAAGLIDRDRYQKLVEAGKAQGLLDPDTGTPVISIKVAHNYDTAAKFVKEDVFGGAEENSLLFDSYELGELAGALGSQILLAYVGVEEVQLALKVVGVLGGGKTVITAIQKDKQWWSSAQFWLGMIGAALSIIGIGAGRAKAGTKILRICQILLAAGAFASGIAEARLMYEHYNNPELAADPERRKMVLARDVVQFAKTLAHVIADAIRMGKGGGMPPARRAPAGGGTEEGSTNAPRKAPAATQPNAPATETTSETTSAPPAPQPKVTAPETTTGSTSVPPAPQPRVTPPGSTTGTTAAPPAPRPSVKPPESTPRASTPPAAPPKVAAPETAAGTTSAPPAPRPMVNPPESTTSGTPPSTSRPAVKPPESTGGTAPPPPTPQLKVTAPEAATETTSAPQARQPGVSAPTTTTGTSSAPPAPRPAFIHPESTTGTPSTPPAPQPSVKAPESTAGASGPPAPRPRVTLPPAPAQEGALPPASGPRIGPPGPETEGPLPPTAKPKVLLPPEPEQEGSSPPEGRPRAPAPKATASEPEPEAEAPAQATPGKKPAPAEAETQPAPEPESASQARARSRKSAEQAEQLKKELAYYKEEASRAGTAAQAKRDEARRYKAEEEARRGNPQLGDPAEARRQAAVANKEARRLEREARDARKVVDETQAVHDEAAARAESQRRQADLHKRIAELEDQYKNTDYARRNMIPPTSTEEGLLRWEIGALKARLQSEIDNEAHPAYKGLRKARPGAEDEELMMANLPKPLQGPSGRPIDVTNPGAEIPPGEVTYDHIYAVRRIAREAGVEKLNPAQREQVAVLAENWLPLTGEANSSKGGRTMAEWFTTPQGSKVPPNLRPVLLDMEARGMAAVRQKIEEFGGKK